MRTIEGTRVPRLCEPCCCRAGHRPAIACADSISSVGVKWVRFASTFFPWCHLVALLEEGIEASRHEATAGPNQYGDRGDGGDGWRASSESWLAMGAIVPARRT